MANKRRFAELSAIATFGDRDEARSPRGISNEEYEKFKARGKVHKAIVKQRADEALKTWQKKLVAAGVSHEPYAQGDTEKKNRYAWCLGIGTPPKPKSTMFSVGSGPVLDDVRGEPWNLANYLNSYDFAKPCVLYAETPEALWPDTDLVYIIAAGVRFVISRDMVVPYEGVHHAIKEAIKDLIEAQGKHLKPTTYEYQAYLKYLCRASVTEEELHAAVRESGERYLERIRLAQRAKQAKYRSMLESADAELNALNAAIEPLESSEKLN